MTTSTRPTVPRIESLTAVRGIGRWTAEMFLIFVLNRPDLLPVDDLGLRKTVQSAYALPDLPKPDNLTALAEPWRPYRTIATWYLWRRSARCRVQQKVDPMLGRNSRTTELCWVHGTDSQCHRVHPSTQSTSRIRVVDLTA